MEEAKKILFFGAAKDASFIRSTGTYSASSEQSNNGSCIDTQIMPSATTEIELVVRVTPGAPVQHWPYLLGCQSANDNADTIALRGYNLQNQQGSVIARPWRRFRFGHSGWSDFGNGTSSWSGTEDWHLLHISKNKVIIDNIEEHVPTASDSSRYAACSLAIGAIHRGTTFTNCIPHDLASIKIWKDGQLVCSMTPVVEDGKVGMLDTARGNVFFQSALSSYQYQFFQK